MDITANAETQLYEQKIFCSSFVTNYTQNISKHLTVLIQ